MNRTTVLIVDDDIGVLSAIRAELRKESYDLLFADRPSLALEMLAQRHDQISVVVSDFDMPEMDGMEFLGRVRDRYPHIIRLLLTGHSTLQLAVDAINKGEVYRFLTKPWDGDELRQTLRQTLQYGERQRENQQLRHQVHQEERAIEALEVDHPGIADVRRDDTGVFVVIDVPEEFGIG